MLLVTVFDVPLLKICPIFATTVLNADAVFSQIPPFSAQFVEIVL